MPLLLFVLAWASVFAQDPLVYTIAGPGPATPSVHDGAIGTKVSLPAVTAAAIDPRGRVFFATFNSIFRLAKDGTLAFVAGQPKGLTQEGAASAATRIDRIAAIDFDGAGNLFYLDSQQRSVRRIDTIGRVTTVGPPLTGQPRDLAVAPDGSVWVLAAQSGIRILPNGTTLPFSVAGDPRAITFGPDGLLYYTLGGSIYRRTSGGQDEQVYSGAQRNPVGGIDLIGPSGSIRIDSVGNIWFYASNLIHKLSPSGTAVQVAGFADAGYVGEYSPASAARFRGPACVLPDHEGGVYICDSGNGTLRYIDREGIIRNVAGRGVPQQQPRPKPENAVELSSAAFALDAFKNVYYRADEGFYRDNNDGTVTYLFGDNTRNDPGESGFSSGAPLNFSVAFHPSGSGIAYDVDSFLHKIFLVRPDGTFDHVAGTGVFESSGDGGPALKASFLPSSPVVLPGGDLLILDRGNIRRISTKTGRISMYASSAGLTPDRLNTDTIPAGSPIPYAWSIALGPDRALYLLGNGPNNDWSRVYRENPDGSWQAIAGRAPSSSTPSDGRSLNLPIGHRTGTLGFDKDGGVLYSEFMIDDGPGALYRFKRDGTFDRVGLPGCFACSSGYDGNLASNTRFSPVRADALPNGDLVVSDAAAFEPSSVRIIPTQPVSAEVDTTPIRLSSTDRHRVLTINSNRQVPYAVQVAMQTGDLWLRTDKRANEVDVIISPDGIPFGTYRGTLLVTVPAFRPEPFVIPVEMTVP